MRILQAFWRFGALHGSVCVHWGRADEMPPVRWGLPGEPGLIDFLQEAAVATRPVTIALGRYPLRGTPGSARSPA